MKTLQRIKSKFGYQFLKQEIHEDIEWYKENNMYEENDEFSFMATIWFEQYSDDMEIAGLTRLYILIISILYEIEIQNVDEIDAELAYIDLRKFNTGKYDDLIDKEDLLMVKRDAQTVCNYLKEHHLI